MIQSGNKPHRETEPSNRSSERARAMAALDLSKLVKERKFWVASFLVAWAAALQGHMMWVQRQDAFKDKFGDPDAPNKVTEGEQPAPSGDGLAGEQQGMVTADGEFR
ncbi:uncharacterized protein [Lolium perenne]|uniref:uncharacterized protein n=1 Tax=Lolium perenne TaxID=4522 RepID=UPI003A990810